MLENSKELQVKLDVFEGPLDLLLHLIKTLEIDIYDIPIVDVTKQYMDYIQSMQTLQLDVAGEYIVMAATLMAIKSKMLLPIQELESDLIEDMYEEGIDPRDALVSQLLEYRKYKYASEILQEKEQERSLYYSKPPSILSEYMDEVVPLEINQVTTIDLFLAFQDVLERQKNKMPIESTVESEEQTIEQKMLFIMDQLHFSSGYQEVTFQSLFQTYSKKEMVTTFMAILELMKKKEIFVRQDQNYGDIYLMDYEQGYKKGIEDGKTSDA